MDNPRQLSVLARGGGSAATGAAGRAGRAGRAGGDPGLLKLPISEGCTGSFVDCGGFAESLALGAGAGTSKGEDEGEGNAGGVDTVAGGDGATGTGAATGAGALTTGATAGAGLAADSGCIDIAVELAAASGSLTLGADGPFHHMMTNPIKIISTMILPHNRRLGRW